jgi:uncharacterized protein CbrC (UPF0167 family)
MISSVILPEENMRQFATALRAFVTTSLLFSSLAFSSTFAQAQENIALDKPVTASSSEISSLAPEKAVDGLSNSRWSSAFADNQWLAIDLGKRYDLSGIKLNWQNSYGREYHIQISDDGTNWSTAFTEANGDGGVDSISLTASARYVRMYGVKRFTRYGFSLWEFEVYGSPYVDRSTNIALNKQIATSSDENTSLAGSYAVDGLANSRWSSTFTDNQWISVDLGAVHQVTGVRLNWQNSYGREYHIQTSNDGVNWSTAFTERDGNGGVDSISLNTAARYVRMLGLKRHTRYGFSLWEFEVYGMQNVTNVARAKKVTTSSNESNSLTGANATDGSTTSRWSSSFADNQWLTVDLGSNHQISSVKLNWQNSYAVEYQLQTSANGSDWKTVAHVRDSDGGIDEITLNAAGRYVRMLGIKRSTRYGFSLWEMEVYGYASGGNGSSSSSSSSANSSNSSSSSSSNGGTPGSGSSSSSGKDTSAPTVPGNIKAAGLDTRIEVSWAPSIDNVAVTGYQIYRNNVKVADVSAAVNIYVDNKVAQNTNYTYTLRARDAAGNWSAQSTAITAKLAASSAGQVTLRWSLPNARENGEYLELDEIGGFEVRYKKTSDSVYTSKLIQDNRTTSINLNLTGAYQFEIAAYDTNGLYSVFIPIQPQ